MTRLENRNSYPSMSRIFIIISSLGIALAALLTFIYIDETISFVQNPEVYHQVHHFGEHAFKWKYKTDFTFIVSNILNSIIGVSYIIASILFLLKFDQRKKLRYLLLIFEVLLILHSAYWYYQWSLIGFDHF